MTMPSKPGRPTSLDIWSDVACPWCYIGKRTFDVGLAHFADRSNVTVTYHSYLVSPKAPVDYAGSAFDFLVHQKGIPAGQVQQMVAHVARSAAEVGLVYNAHRLSPTNTRKTHQLLHFAKTQGVQPALLDRLFNAYFAEGRAIGCVDELADLAADVGLARDEAFSALRRNTFATAVAADIETARAHGITGVPLYLVNGTYGLSGVQAPETFTSLLEAVRTKEADPA